MAWGSSMVNWSLVSASAENQAIAAGEIAVGPVDKLADLLPISEVSPPGASQTEEDDPGFPEEEEGSGQTHLSGSGTMTPRFWSSLVG